MPIAIRPMLPADLELGMRLKADAGWNQVEADWRRSLDLAPEGCFVALADGQPAGTTTTCAFGPVGWLAMVLVDAQYRGQGIGRALLEHALEHLDNRGIASVRLDATPLGRPLYEKLGFVAEYELARFAGQPSAVAGSSPHVEPATVEDVDPIVALDRRSTGTDRARLVQYMLAEERSLAARRAFIEWHRRLPARPAGSIGAADRPLPGIRVGGNRLACRRAHEARRPAGLRRHPTPATIGQRPRPAHGLTVQRPLVRMTRGPVVFERPELLWASFGPEKG